MLHNDLRLNEVAETPDPLLYKLKIKKNMEKIERRFNIDYHLSWSCIEIKKMREDLDLLETLGATYIEINCYDDYGSIYAEIKAYAERIETDEECKAREEEEFQRKERTVRMELDQLEKLKLKYGQ